MPEQRQYPEIDQFLKRVYDKVQNPEEPTRMKDFKKISQVKEPMLEEFMGTPEFRALDKSCKIYLERACLLIENGIKNTKQWGEYKKWPKRLIGR